MRVSIDQRGHFDCPNCGNESETSPFPGKSVVCEHCGKRSPVGDIGYLEMDWNKRNARKATELSAK